MPSANSLTLQDLPAPPPQLSLQDLPAPPSPWMARAQSLGAGLEDLISGPAVALTRALPEPVVRAGDQLNNWLAAKTHLFPTIPQGGLSELQAQREQALEATRAGAGLQGMDWSRLAGQTIPWVVAPEVGGAGLLGKILYGGTTGAIQGLEQPTDNGESQVKNALIGAGIGAALPGATGIAGRMIRGVQSPAVKDLTKAGVTLTPGQLFGGAARGVEERLAGLPFVGDIIKQAERRGINEFNHATANQVLAPLGVTAPKDIKPGYDLLHHVYDTIDQGYEELKPHLVGKADPKFVRDLAHLRAAAQTLPPAQRDQVDQFFKQDILDRFNPKTMQMTGHQLKDVETKLGQEARAYLRAQDPDQKKLGAILQQAQLSLRRMTERVNPQFKGQLSKLNSAYARYLRMEGATGRVAGEEEAAGAFTPAQLRASVRSLDETARKRAFHKGTSLMQPWAETGQHILASKVPDSGTAGRAMVGALALGAPGAWHPMLGAGLAALPFYTPTGQRILQRLAVREGTPATNALAQLLMRAPTAPLTAAAVPWLTNPSQ